MSEPRPCAYGEYYYAHDCGRPYQRDEGWLGFFGGIAERIVHDIAPRTALDAGCAMGFLVESLRDRGVEAYGLDVSSYAIERVRPDMRPYCHVASITEPLDRKYDLIVSIEVLEHLTPREAEAAVANLCAHGDNILFSSTPEDFREVTHINVQPPEHWAEMFARHGFYRDVDFDARFITPWAARFRRAAGPVSAIIAGYERRLWQVQKEAQARRLFNVEQRDELAARESSIQDLGARLAEKEQTIVGLGAQLGDKELVIQALTAQVRQAATDLRIVQTSRAWRLTQRLIALRLFLIPPKSRRERLFYLSALGVYVLRTSGPRIFLNRLRNKLSSSLTAASRRIRRQSTRSPHTQTIPVEPVASRPPALPHSVPVDIVVCVHNALPDVTRCLESVREQTSQPYSLILVDDGSDAATRDFLGVFAAANQAVLLRNDEARGYTRAANLGLRQARSDYVVLLNSDTVITQSWLDRMVACAESDPHIAAVGPLSNTASWQSVPEIEGEGDWANNPLPPGMTISEMGQLTARYSDRLYPPMLLLNGFCWLLRRRAVEELGYLDEENFGAGYGEEDDFNLRARKAGWLLALADDVYVYHAQSRSYSTEKRRRLCASAGEALVRKHGHQPVSESVRTVRNDRVLEGIRARAAAMVERQDFIKRGRAAFSRKSVLFVLPINLPGGGGNIVIREAIAMREMGVDARILNLRQYRDSFEKAYPDLEVPVCYAGPDEIAAVASSYDAVVATMNTSVDWLRQVVRTNGSPVRGYYIQGFEPYCYEPGTAAYRAAEDSYSLLPDLVRFTKTEWTRHEVQSKTGVDCAIVGVTIDIDLFRPRPYLAPRSPSGPIRIAAMVRPNSLYRAPELTMDVLRRAARRFGDRVEIVTFGTSPDDPWLAELPHDFPWQAAGVLDQRRVARLLNEVDVFVDFSTHQAMGLTALEAMACGAATIVPALGGAVDFARHEENSLVVDTSSPEACWQALQRLVEDDGLRTRLRGAALRDVCAFYPEAAAFNILTALFGAGRDQGT